MIWFEDDFRNGPMTTDRLARLMKALEARNDDPFLLYAIALEHKNEGGSDEALRWFEDTRRRFPAYVPTYYHYGMLHADLGDLENAEKMFREGISRAEEAGDGHARSELVRALEDLDLLR